MASFFGPRSPILAKEILGVPESALIEMSFNIQADLVQRVIYLGK